MKYLLEKIKKVSEHHSNNLYELEKELNDTYYVPAMKECYNILTGETWSLPTNGDLNRIKFVKNFLGIFLNYARNTAK